MGLNENYYRLKNLLDSKEFEELLSRHRMAMTVKDGVIAKDKIKKFLLEHLAPLKLCDLCALEATVMIDDFEGAHYYCEYHFSLED